MAQQPGSGNPAESSPPSWLVGERAPQEPAQPERSRRKSPSPAEMWQGLQTWARGVSVESWILGVVAFGALAVCYWSPTAFMVDMWDDYADYYHGPFVPLIALWLVWRRLPVLVRIERQPAALGVLPLALGLFLRWIGEAISVQALSMGSLLVVLCGLIWCFWGYRMARALLFPVCFLIFMIPIPFPLLAAMGFPLQGWTTTGVYWLGKLVGLPIIRGGFELVVYDFHAAVVQTCSGLHSLFALLMLGVLLAQDMNLSLLRKSIMVAMILPIVLMANIFRVFLTILVAVLFGPALAEGMFHWASGMILFGVALLGFLYVRRLITTPREKRQRASRVTKSEAPRVPPVEW